MNLKIAILGTRGIPNHYGGYEQAATFLAVGLVGLGHRVTVYNSHNHPFQDKKYDGVDIVHCFDPEYKAGTAGQFIYDLNCLRHAHKKNYDVLLLLGYTSSSIWGRFYPKKTIIISNMDGLEWKRRKYSVAVRRFLKYAERLAIRHSDYYIADSLVIKGYLQEKYGVDSCYIPYGAEVPAIADESILQEYGVIKGNYYLLIARLEAENNIAEILEGFAGANTKKTFLVVGNTGTKLGTLLKKRFAGYTSIKFTGAIFNQGHLHSLRKYCTLYFHGHSVGGTNPSLLEAMASEAVIAAHDNAFNKAILGKDAFYFSSAVDVKHIVQTFLGESIISSMKQNNLAKIKEQYTWKKITSQYDAFIKDCYFKSNP